MNTAEIVAMVIGGWSLVSLLFGLAVGRIIQVYRCRCPLESEVFDEPLRENFEGDPADSKQPPQHSQTPSSLCA